MQVAALPAPYRHGMAMTAQNMLLVFLFVGVPALLLASLASLIVAHQLRHRRRGWAVAIAAVSLVVGVSTGLLTYGTYSAEVVTHDRWQ